MINFKFEKNISKSHGCIELKESSSGEIADCLLWDTNSLNRIIFNEKALEPNQKVEINLGDKIEFAGIRFELVKVEIWLTVGQIYIY